MPYVNYGMNADKVRILFFDTSALVKRYHQEKGTDVVDTAFNQEGVKIISDISVIEFFSAFAKKVRIGEISKEDFQVTIKELAEDVLLEVIQLEQFGENEKRAATDPVPNFPMSIPRSISSDLRQINKLMERPRSSEF